ncbi:oxygenase MpaB family protein [Rufibacter immobilis]|uniref:oxygenase MpaB family protein n=1 Tax=Rufibacter immobilis TaxID=1348778 RepID=UPI0035E963A7
MIYFVPKGSVVREIWGKGDTILFIFAGAAAEFALNKAVDWLYFTGRLPKDPLGRLFSTVGYARQIVFSEQDAAHRAIDTMAKIHAGVEAKRGMAIPDWAYRDVLFMLIDYSIRSYELLERKLTLLEKEEVFEVFSRVGTRMGLTGLPTDYQAWLTMRQEHLEQNLVQSHFTRDLFQQYKKHLGLVRYHVLLQAQILVVPQTVNFMLKLGRVSLVAPLLPVYKFSQKLKLDWVLKTLLLPNAYMAQIKELDKAPASASVPKAA